MKFKVDLKSFIWQKKINTSTITLIIIGIGIGILFTAQWRTLPSRASDPVISYSSLVGTKEDLTREQNSLKEQIEKLNTQISSAQVELKKYANSKDKVEEVEKYEKKIGLTQLSGQGIIITFNDSNYSEVDAEGITHAADLRDMINVLWGAGAQGISINDERIVFNTSIDCVVNTILVNTTKMSPPFIIRAVGDKDDLYSSITNRDKLKDIYRRVDSDGLILKVEKNLSVIIKPYNGSLKNNYATIK